MTHLVSFSELDAFRQCPHKHQLSYKERWQGSSTSPALRRGTLWHAVLETHYRYLLECQHPDVTYDPNELLARVRPFFYPEVGDPTEDQELIHWMYLGHIDHYGTDPNWKILAVEHNAQVWLPTLKGTRSSFKLKIKIDLVVLDRRTGGLWVVDHKSGKDLPTEKMLDIDDQFGLYTWGLRQLGKQVMGSLHSAARTQRNKDQTKHPQALEDRFRRTRLFRTDVELDRIAQEAYLTFRRAYAIKGEAERAPNSDTCRWRCDYTEQCLGGRKGMDERQFLIDSGFIQDFTRH